jgi:hypothetical protein
MLSCVFSMYNDTSNFSLIFFCIYSLFDLVSGCSSQILDLHVPLAATSPFKKVKSFVLTIGVHCPCLMLEEIHLCRPTNERSSEDLLL